jgi:putative transposase
MRQNLKKYGHGVGRLYAHIRFKTKYCCKVFEKEPVFREACEKLFYEIAEQHNIDIGIPGFDDNHMHMIVDIGIRSIPEIKKIFKGTSGRKLFQQFPDIKRKYFWSNTGLWGRSVYFYGVGRDKVAMEKYIAKQKFAKRTTKDKYQQTLFSDFN